VDLDREKSIKILLLAGIICLILSPILGFALARMPVYGASDETTDERYDHLGVQSAFYKEFTLGTNQRAMIYAAVDNYLNVSINIKIVKKGEMEKALLDNINDTFANLAALWCIYSQPQFDNTPGGTDVVETTTVTLDYDLGGGPSYAYIEFMGASDGGDNLRTRPGGYYVVIEGANDDPGGGWQADTIVRFDIDIKVEGPGRTIMTVFAIVGLLLLIGSIGYALVNSIKTSVGGGR
jgi:hypothetical protein